MTPEQTVRDFCAAASRCRAADVLDFFTDDAVYHNIPLDPLRGRDAIQATLAQFLDIASTVEFEILALAVTGNTVLTERVDRFVIGGKAIALPVMGAFDVTADGKIAAWRDYFDMQQFTTQMG